MNTIEVTIPDFTYDIMFCKMNGFNYIKINEFADDTEQRMSEFCNDLVLQCRCVADENGRKCVDATCPLRAVQIECDPSRCGASCSNNEISSILDPNYLLITSNDVYGRCVQATAAIADGTRIVEYVGKVQRTGVTPNQFYAHPISWAGTDVGMIVNSLKEGNETRLIPHSASPNCVVVPWIAQRQIRLVVTACKDIKVDEVLTISYPQHRGPGVHINVEEDYLPAFIDIGNGNN